MLYESFQRKLDGFCVSFLFLGNSRQYMPVCAKMISSWVRKFLDISRACMSLGTPWGLLPWHLVFSWCPSNRQVIWPAFLPHLGTIIPCASLLWIGTWIQYHELSWPQ